MRNIILPVLIFNLYLFLQRDRFFAVSKPIKHKQDQSKRNKKIVIALFVYCFIISLPFIYYPSLIEYAKPDASEPFFFKLSVKCEIPNSGDILLTLLDSIIFCFCPFLISMFFSSLTLVLLIKRNKSTTHGSNTFNQSNQAFSKPYFGASYNSRKSEIISLHDLNKYAQNNPRLSLNTINTEINGHPSQTRFGSLFSNVDIQNNDLKSMVINNSKNSSTIRLTAMLMTFPLSYLMCTFPVFLIISFKLGNHYFESKKSNNYDVAFYLAKILMYFNNSTSILIFILFGKNLRKDFFNLLTFKKARKL